MEDFKKILLINYGGIGDEILFLPVITSLKKQYPDVKISLALEPRSKSIKDLTNNIDEVICVDIKAKGLIKYLNILFFIFKCWFKSFDCVISSGKSPFVAIILFLTQIKERIGYCSKTDFLLTKKVSLDENQYAGKMYHSLVEPIVSYEYENPKIQTEKHPELLPDDEFICIHPGVSKMSISKNILKCPRLNFWRGLIAGLLEKGKKIVLLGTKDDKDLIDEILKNEKITQNSNFINYFGKTKNIMEMAYIMEKSSYVICVDSAPLHVAVSVNANIFAIFGPTNEKKLVPARDNIEIITSNSPCRPCLWHLRAQNCQKSECLNIDFNLILDKIN